MDGLQQVLLGGARRTSESECPRASRPDRTGGGRVRCEDGGVNQSSDASAWLVGEPEPYLPAGQHLAEFLNRASSAFTPNSHLVVEDGFGASSGQPSSGKAEVTPTSLTSIHQTTGGRHLARNLPPPRTVKATVTLVDVAERAGICGQV